MTTGKLLGATLAGAATAFVVGFLIYVLALGGFFEANMGSATGVLRDPPNLALVALGQLPIAFFLALVISRWNDRVSVADGAKVGALFGFLVSLGFDLTQYATMNVSNLTATLADPVASIVLGGVTGAAIGMVLSRGPATASSA